MSRISGRRILALRAAASLQIRRRFARAEPRQRIEDGEIRHECSPVAGVRRVVVDDVAQFDLRGGECARINVRTRGRPGQIHVPFDGATDADQTLIAADDRAWDVRAALEKGPQPEERADGFVKADREIGQATVGRAQGRLHHGKHRLEEWRPRVATPDRVEVLPPPRLRIIDFDIADPLRETSLRGDGNGEPLGGIGSDPVAGAPVTLCILGVVVPHPYVRLPYQIEVANPRYIIRLLDNDRPLHLHGPGSGGYTIIAR